MNATGDVLTANRNDGEAGRWNCRPPEPVKLNPLFHAHFQQIGPVFSHSGFEKVIAKDTEMARAGDFFHQLHHRCSECNYGTSEIPFDKWFGTFHDGSAEAVQQDLAPEMPFTQMLSPIYGRMAPEMGLPPGRGEAFRASIPDWPAFPDSVEALRRLRTRFRLVALTNADNWALGHMAATLGKPFHDTVTCEDVGVNGFGASPVPDTVTQPDLHFATLAELADHLDAALAST